MTIGLTGGCQCGAVRYRLNEAPSNPHLCHCRMCQKAFGSFFAPLAGVHLVAFQVTRGALTKFRSSDQVDRGFCANCGTPLSFQSRDGDTICVSIGSLDNPEAVIPQDQHGIEARISYFHRLANLPDRPTTEDEDPQGAARIRASSHQHPDHDTTGWRVTRAHH
jgi:hypothetical protein